MQILGIIVLILLAIGSLVVFGTMSIISIGILILAVAVIALFFGILNK